ncbi:heterokaryon incompatibility protein-domain-containing protein, partial [Trametes meyenii]
MWLLNTKTYELKYFPSGTDRPRYAILSHCWDKEEITFADVRKRPLLWTRRKPGWRKVKHACAAVREHKAGGVAIEWLWDDTCCIDKSSSAELSEALNSMFSWYRDAWICFAYLNDVPGGQDPEREGSAFRSSRWFTRGWTLQELIAAKSWMVFLSGDWRKIGTCEELAPVIEDITHIDSKLLLSRGPERTDIIRGMSVAARMAWASGRETTRAEDKAYSLMGIFDVHMPILYGEGGERAFRRLQLEIIQQTTDQTIFAY